MNFIAALLYSVAASVLIALILGFQNGALDAQVAILSLAGGAAAGAAGWWLGRKEPPLPPPRSWAWVPVVIFAIFGLRAFLWLIFHEEDELRVLSPNNLGDMSLHLTFIQYLANGAPLWPDSPIFSAGKLTYSAGIDVFNSLLTLAGADVVRGLIWTGLAGALATGFALWRWGGAFTLLGFLCNGGLVGFACLTAGPDQPFFSDYQSGWAWKSLPLAILVTQRGFLFALPAGLLLLSSWRTRFFHDGNGWKLPFAGELLLYAAMPFFHLHTFAALSFMLAAFFVARAPARMKLAQLAVAAFVPATLLVYLTLGMFQTNPEPLLQDMSQVEHPPQRPPIKALGWQPGWMVNDDVTADAWTRAAGDSPAAERFARHGRFLFFWLGNFGVLPLLLVPLVLGLLRQIQGRDIRPIHVLAGLLAAGAITPLLGAWDGYQHRSFGGMLAGDGPYARHRMVLGALLAIGAAFAVLVLHTRKIRDFGLRWLLLGMTALYVIDVSLRAVHAWSPRIPLLKASAAPLVLATLGFALLLVRMARRRESADWTAAFVFPALYLFFLCCNVKFATWDWDNTKLMLWAYVVLLPFVWELLIARWPLWARAATCSLLFFSGFVSLVGGIDGTHQGHPIARLSQLDAVRDAVQDIPVTESFAALPTYNHPLLLCGRKVVMGYEGHLGSHGIRYQAIQAELDALMRGHPLWRLSAAQLGVRYLYFGPDEREHWPSSSQPWREGARLVASGDWGEVFDLDTPPIPLADPLPEAPR